MILVVFAAATVWAVTVNGFLEKPRLDVEYFYCGEASRPGGRTIWSYTFTPSGGFGWPKRTFTFDSRGVLVDALYLDEP